MARFKTIDGMVLRVGSPTWRWFTRNRARIEGVWLKAKHKVTRHKFVQLEGVDGVSVPFGAQLAAAGKHFAGRYLSIEGNPKNITKTEAADLHQHGLGVVLFFETTGTTFEGGRKAGVADAQSALAQLKALGVPTHGSNGCQVAVFFTIDTDPHGKEPLIASYASGAKSVLAPAGYGTGIYGGFGAVAAAKGIADYFVQAYAWSGGLWHPLARLQQYANGQTVAGHTVDLERQVRPDAGIWY